MVWEKVWENVLILRTLTLVMMLVLEELYSREGSRGHVSKQSKHKHGSVLITWFLKILKKVVVLKKVVKVERVESSCVLENS